jgi:hypothetical protein
MIRSGTFGMPIRGSQVNNFGAHPKQISAKQDAENDSCVDRQYGREGHAALVAASLANQDDLRK